MLFQDLGKTLKRIFEPSKGGIGIKLKIARAKFISTIIWGIAKEYPEIPLAKATLIKIPKIMAIKMFAKIPAEATAIVPFLLSRKLFGL